MKKNNKSSDLFRSLRNAVAIGLILFVIGSFTEARGSNLNPRQIILVQLAEKWLNGFKTFKAGFTQTSSNGTSAVGDIEIIRPGRMLINYKRPDGLQIFADGTWLIYIDRNLKEVNQVPIKLTPARVLLQDKIELIGQASVRIEESKTKFRLALLPGKGSEDGNITLIFSKNPSKLISWIVTDPQGIQTTVLLDNIAINIPIEQGRLTYSPPDWAFE
ncbi:MAG: outer membrane lipoprotein carrier protein LolA [Pseudomonadota bacterium]|nr:outer membrane lipoprotein carrier protein LolA [Pseudomonadota bacterium]